MYKKTRLLHISKKKKNNRKKTTEKFFFKRQRLHQYIQHWIQGSLYIDIVMGMRNNAKVCLHLAKNYKFGNAIQPWQREWRGNSPPQNTRSSARGGVSNNWKRDEGQGQTGCYSASTPDSTIVLILSQGWFSKNFTMNGSKQYIIRKQSVDRKMTKKTYKILLSR